MKKFSEMDIPNDLIKVDRDEWYKAVTSYHKLFPNKKSMKGIEEADGDTSTVVYYTEDGEVFSINTYDRFTHKHISYSLNKSLLNP